MIDALPVGQQAFWACAFYGGLRRGELRALRWDDVDLARTVARSTCADRGTTRRATSRPRPQPASAPCRSRASCAGCWSPTRWRQGAAGRISCSVAPRRTRSFRRRCATRPARFGRRPGYADFAARGAAQRRELPDRGRAQRSRIDDDDRAQRPPHHEGDLWAPVPGLAQGDRGKLDAYLTATGARHEPSSRFENRRVA